MTDQCNHYFEWGYTLEPVVYCTKCDKELDELGIPLTILSNHDIVGGKFILRPLISTKRGFFAKLFNL